MDDRQYTFSAHGAQQMMSSDDSLPILMDKLSSDDMTSNACQLRISNRSEAIKISLYLHISILVTDIFRVKVTSSVEGNG